MGAKVHYIASETTMEAQQDRRLQKGIDEFNQQLFFECHETLEEIWLEEHGENRRFYQGVIQIAAGYFKWQQNVPAGALKLWRMGLEKIEPYGPVHLGVDLASLAEAVREHLQELELAQEKGSEWPVLSFPILYRVS
jgi:predicted metal-dependent hydrolase